MRKSGFVRAFALVVLAMLLVYVSTEMAGKSIVVQAAENSDTQANVKVVKEIRYHLDGSIRVVYVDTYDEKDRLLEKVQYDGEGNITLWEEISYDENGRFIGRTEYDEDGKVKLYSIIDADKYEGVRIDTTGDIYDRDGNIIGQTVLQIVDDTFENLIWVEYVDGERYKGFKRKNTIWGESAGEQGPYLEKLDTTNGIARVDRYNKQGVLYETQYYVPKYNVWTTTYEYDTQGRIASTISHVVWGRSTYDVKSKAVYYYDNQNRLEKILDDEAESQTYFTYNEKGDLTEEITYVQDGKVLYVKEYTYETR